MRRDAAPRRPLTKVQRNDVFILIKRVGLEPEDFEWTEMPTFDDGSGDICPLITHGPTGYVFHFGFNSSLGSGDFIGRWDPPFPGSGEIEAQVHSWEHFAEFFFRWLQLVKADVDAPDFWEALRSEKAITDAAASDADNRPFDPHELRELDEKLSELNSFLETRYVQDASDRVTLGSRFGYLRDAAKRGIGRIDWLNIFVAQMMTMVVAGVIPSTAYGDAMRMAATLFHSLIATLKALGS